MSPETFARIVDQFPSTSCRLRLPPGDWFWVPMRLLIKAVVWFGVCLLPPAYWQLRSAHCSLGRWGSGGVAGRGARTVDGVVDKGFMYLWRWWLGAWLRVISERTLAG
jgi:hypothetical protein